MTSFDWIYQGQQATAQGNYLDALSCHQQALNRAQANCRQTLGMNPEAALNAVLDCWLLIARSCAALGMVKSVAAVAMRAEGFVVDQMLEAPEKDDELIKACDRSFQRFRKLWSGFTHEYPQAGLPQIGQLEAWELPCRTQSGSSVRGTYSDSPVRGTHSGLSVRGTEANRSWISGGLH